MPSWNLNKAIAHGVVYASVLALGLCIVSPLGYAETAAPDEGETVDISQLQISFTAPYRQGVDAYHQGDFEQALMHLRQANNADPYNVNVRYYMAVVLDKLGHGAEASDHYRYVVRHSREAAIVAYASKRIGALVSSQSVAATQLMATESSVASSGSGISVPLKPHNNALMVEATLNNKATGTFIVDTGATYTSISQELYEQLDPDSVTQIGTVKITTANGRIEVPKILIDRVNINGLEARNVEATVIDVRKSSSFSGLLGLSFIRHFRLTIDPTESTLVFQAL